MNLTRALLGGLAGVSSAGVGCALVLGLEPGEVADGVVGDSQADTFTSDISSSDSGAVDSADDSSVETSPEVAGDADACVGLRCRQKVCPSGGDTTVSGVVYAPNGTLPLYNVLVYVPNATPGPLAKGVQCDRCSNPATDDPVTMTLTDAEGKFRLTNVPVGSAVPLVIKTGKWRRQVTIPIVNECVDNPLTDANLTRLPKNTGEGDIPKIAITIGGCDKLACMLPKIGLDASEFGVDGSPASVHFYAPSGGFGASGPAGMKDARVLWSDAAKLKQYDIAIFSCECSEVAGPAPSGSKDATSYAAVDEYLKAGGRIFTTDFQYLWYKQSSDANMRAVVPIPGGAPTGTNPVDLVTTFPKGKALADWLKHVDSTVVPGKVRCDYVFNNMSPADPTKSQLWGASLGIDGAAGTTNNPRFLTINTPVGKPVAEQCGKAVHLDAHINSADTIDVSFPSGCTGAVKQGERAFAFLFFDLASCLQDDGVAPRLPPLK